MSEVPKPDDNSNTNQGTQETPVTQTAPVIQGGQVTQVVQINDANPANPANADAITNAPKSKSKKKKNKLGVAAPRQPLTGYIRYLNSRRENLRNENPNLTFPDITKILAQEWANLSSEEKRPYLEAGEQDRERYLQEMESYKKTEEYKDYLRQLEEKQKAKEKQREPPAKEPEEKKIKYTIENGQRIISGFDIPIFTDDFLELNRAREAELRQLRRNSSDFELQNASLSRIVESMRTAVDSLESGIKGRQDSNFSIYHHLEQMRASLTAAFHAVALPGSGARATVDTVDEFMVQLHSLLTGEESNKHFQLLARVSGILDRLEFHS